MANTDVVEGKTSSGRSVENLYFDKAGKLHSRPPNDVVGIVKKFKAGGEVKALLSDFESEHSIFQLACFGLHQVLQNAYGAAGDDDEKVELAEARLETIKGGSWSSDRQSGPRTSDLLTAFIRGYTAKNGKAPDDEWVNTKRDWLSDEAVAKEAAKYPAIKAQLETIKSERQIERARKAAEAAGNAVDDDQDIFA